MIPCNKKYVRVLRQWVWIGASCLSLISDWEQRKRETSSTPMASRWTKQRRWQRISKSRWLIGILAFPQTHKWKSNTFARTSSPCLALRKYSVGGKWCRCSLSLARTTPLQGWYLEDSVEGELPQDWTAKRVHQKIIVFFGSWRQKDRSTRNGLGYPVKMGWIESCIMIVLVRNKCSRQTNRE